ncbi:MAG: TlpA family protein disulfide reductase [Magnetococcus sp. DMHC-8]
MNWKKYCKPLFLLLLLAWTLTGCSKPLDPLRVGDAAPPFALTLITGEARTLDHYRGKGLVVTFMSSWCPCSNDSLPLFKEAHLRHQNQVAFLMVGIQEAESKFKEFVKKREITYEAGYDTSKMARTYGVNAPPTTVFIDKNGVVKQFFYGNIKDKAAEFAGWVAEVAS